MPRRDGRASGGARMKILIVSWYFPPCNTMGALRTGKLAKYLLGRGHDVRVVCAKDQPFDMTLPVEFPAERTHYTPWLDINGFPKLVQRLRVRCGLARPERDGGGSRPAVAGSPDAVVPSAPVPGARALRKVRDLYTVALNCPDSRIGWLPYACREARRVVDGWRPEIVFVTAPPHTALIVGNWIGRKFDLPWVAEYRDRWVEDPYGTQPHWRDRFDRWAEDRLIGNASGLVTVSEPWAEDYRRRWGLPAVVVHNGFDPDDYPTEFDRGDPEPDTLRIVYTGILYPDRRDPSPLFEALKLLGDRASGLRVEFYGVDRNLLEPVIDRFGVGDRVHVRDPVPYDECVRVQMRADVLLLMQWNDPREQGNVPGKLFEYIGARRPVLCLGLENGVPAKILSERGAGVVANDPAEIARLLERWMGEKKAGGVMKLLPPSARDGLSRDDQFARLEAFLHGFVDGSEIDREPVDGLPIAPRMASRS